MRQLSLYPLIFFSKKLEMKRHEQKTPAPEPHIPVELNVLYTHTHISHIFSTHRTHVAFPVNVLSGRQRRWSWRYGGGFGGGSEGIAVMRRQGRMVVTRTGHCHPLAIVDTTLPPPCKITLCRTRWEITFCPSITGWIFGQRDPIISNEIRDTTPIWDVSGKGCRMSIVVNHVPLFATSHSISNN